MCTILVFLINRYLQHLMTSNNTPTLIGSDYRIALLCNAYSTNQEYYARPMGIIIETLFGSQKVRLFDVMKFTSDYQLACLLLHTTATVQHQVTI